MKLRVYEQRLSRNSMFACHADLQRERRSGMKIMRTGDIRSLSENVFHVKYIENEENRQYC